MSSQADVTQCTGLLLEAPPWPRKQTALAAGPALIRTCCSFNRLLHTMGNSSTQRWCATAAPCCTSSIKQET